MPNINMSQLIEDVKVDEGTILHAYVDNRGYTTIGSGILIDQRGGGITDAENEMLLENRLNITISNLDLKLPWIVTKSDNIQRQITNMAYQLGVSGVLQFQNMLSYLKADNFSAAADAALDSAWAKQTPNRAQRVTNCIRQG